jgi:hypothetical protein
MEPSQASAAQTLTPSKRAHVLLRVGVTGHRMLSDPGNLAKKVNEALATMESWFEDTPPSYEILSSLADGADRLVAECIIKRKSAEVPPLLRAILPMRQDVYYGTFLTAEEILKSGAVPPTDFDSVAEFQRFLQNATVLVAPLPKTSLGTDPANIYKLEDHRHYAYRWSGEYVVNHCDLLIAIWNGKAETRVGSSAQIVKYARKNGRSLVWINSATGELRWEISSDDLVAQYYCLAKYRDELSAELPDPLTAEQHYLRLVAEANTANFNEQGFDALLREVLPLQVKASTLATRYQNLYFRVGTLGYLCAAAAVFTAAWLSLLAPKAPPESYFIEALFITGALVSGLLMKNKGWQKKWIDFRYLTERLRATSFLYVANVEFELLPEYPDLRFNWLPEGWVTLLLRKVWNKLPPVDPDGKKFNNPKHVRALTSFLYHAWIHDQQDYYDAASDKNKERNEILEYISLGLLWLTLGIAVAYGFGRFEGFHRDLERLGEWPHMLAVALPAVTGALAGIMIFRHFGRNADRYSSMSHFLSAVETQLLGAAGLDGNENDGVDLPRVQALIREADRAMAHEHEGWRTVFGVRLPGPG